MRKHDPDRPTPFEAIMLEPDAAGRQLVIDRAQQMFLAQGGADLELAINCRRDCLAMYEESRQAQRANPEAKPMMAHREGQRAASQFERLIEKRTRLRDRCLDWARRAVFAETGKRFGPDLWPEDLPGEEPRPTPVPLPNPMESWQPERTARQAQSAAQQWQMANQSLQIDLEGVAEHLLAGKFGPGDLQQIEAELRRDFPDLPEVPNEFKRRLAATVQRIKAGAPA